MIEPAKGPPVLPDGTTTPQSRPASRFPRAPQPTREPRAAPNARYGQPHGRNGAGMHANHLISPRFWPQNAHTVNPIAKMRPEHVPATPLPPLSGRKMPTWSTLSPNRGRNRASDNSIRPFPAPNSQYGQPHGRNGAEAFRASLGKNSHSPVARAVPASTQKAFRR